MNSTRACAAGRPITSISYQIHRWDYETPIEETLEALHDVVKSGKVRYIGASSMYAWQFTKALYLSPIGMAGARFVSMQNHYNLLYREEEREMIPLCQSEGIGVIPWSPLARGRLARPWQGENTKRYRNRSVWQNSVFADRRKRSRVVDRWGNLREARRFRAPKSRWPGCLANRLSRHRSLALRSYIIFRTLSQRFRCILRLKKFHRSKNRTRRTRYSDSANC